MGDAVELALIVAGRLHADVMLGVTLINARIGAEGLSILSLCDIPPEVTNCRSETCMLAFCEGNTVSRWHRDP